MRLHHIGISVKELEKSIGFYEKMFGFQVEQSFEIDGESMVFLVKGDLRLELIEDIGQEKRVDSTVHMAWTVEHLEKMIHSLAINQLHPFEGPLLLKNGWKVAYFRGPDLEMIELVEGV